MATSKMKLKLLVDTNAGRVLFAEAGKDFVDFLFYLLSLPVGAVVKLLNSKSMVGGLGNLYESIKNLGENYMQPDQNKNLVLDPRSSVCTANGSLPLLLSGHANETQKFYTCTKLSAHNYSYGYSKNYYVTDVPNLTCPRCNATMSCEMSYVSLEAAKTGAKVEGGFVKGVVTYMVMDNLEVMPLSTISSITLLNKFNVKDVGKLEERMVDFGIDEALKILKSSFECKTVLTSTFLRNTAGQQSRKRRCT